MSTNDAIEKALETLTPKTQRLEVIDWRPATHGSGTLRGTATLRLPDGRTVAGCDVHQMGGDRWISVGMDRQQHADGSSTWTPRIPFASRAEELTFQAHAVLELDRYLAAQPSEPRPTAQAPGTCQEVNVAGFGRAFLVADDETATTFAKRGIDRGRIWTEAERALIAGITDPGLCKAAVALKQQLGALTADAIAELAEAMKEKVQQEEV